MSDETVAESSPAETEITATESETTEQAAKVEEGAESTAAESTSEPKGESVSASEAAKRSDGRDNAERRIKQLDRQLKETRKELAALKPKSSIPKIVEPAEPKLEEYDTVENFQTATKEFKGKYKEYVLGLDRQEREVAAQKTQQEALEKAANDSWDKAEAATKKRNSEYTSMKELRDSVEPSPAMDGFFVDSEIGPDVLWHLSENPEIADKIRELPPYKAVRELVAIEATLSAKIKGIKKNAVGVKVGGHVSGTGASPAKPRSAEDILYG